METKPKDEQDLMYKLGVMNATLNGLARDIAAVRVQHEKILTQQAAVPDIVRKIIKEETDERLDSHSTRLTALEKWRWIVGGGLMLAIFIMPLALKALDVWSKFDGK